MSQPTNPSSPRTWLDAVGEFEQIDAGVAYWPIDNIVFKLDYSHRSRRDGAGQNESFVNAGVGLEF